MKKLFSQHLSLPKNEHLNLVNIYSYQALVDINKKEDFAMLKERCNGQYCTAQYLSEVSKATFMAISVITELHIIVCCKRAKEAFSFSKTQNFGDAV